MSALRFPALTPQGALLLSLQAGVLVLLVDGAAPLLALTAGALLLWLLAGGARYWGWTLLALGLAGWSMAITQGLFYGGAPRTALLTLLPPGSWTGAGLHLYREGLLHGLVQSLRLDAMGLLGAALVLRFGADELTAGLRALRLPAALCFLLALALRYLPLQGAELRGTWRALRLRGWRPRLRDLWRVGAQPLWPLLAGNLRRADEIALGLAARGYHPSLALERSRPISRGERAAVALGLALVLGFVVLRAGAAAWRAGWPLPSVLEGILGEVARYV